MRIYSHLAVAAAALVAGGVGATAFSSPEPARQENAAPALPVPPEQVRTVVVTKTIHRVRHVRVHARRAAPVAAPPPAPAPAPAPVAVVPQRVAVRAPATTSRPVSTRTSGGGGHGGEHEGGEHEGGGDD